MSGVFLYALLGVGLFVLGLYALTITRICYARSWPSM